jgi:polyhydroxybutyrate depolymerase
VRGWIIIAALAGCQGEPIDECDPLAPGAHAECIVPDWVDRSFSLDVPPQWNGSDPVPLIVVFHGGGGNRQSTDRSTCPDGDRDSPGCISAFAGARGYAVAFPDGTGARPLRNIRTWNGGGGNALQCTSGGACREGINDVRYFDDLLVEIQRALPIDDRRIYVTGISNGGAMSHRLGCERADVVAAVVGVAGANEFADDGGSCAVQVAVRQIHGTADPCWRFDGGSQACLQDDGVPKTSVPMTMEGWRVRNGCAEAFIDVARAERDATEPTTAVVRTWQGCAAATELVIVNGGGHTWPSGYQYLSSDRVGVVSPEVDNADLLDFFDAHRRR